jgi:hypothetical protein
MQNKITISLFAIFFFIGCMPENIALETELLENDFFLPCESVSKTDNIVIRNQEEYEAYFSTINSPELVAELPKIDFSEKTLIGTYTSKPCIRSHLKQIERQGKDVIYTVTLEGNDGCPDPYVAMNWALTPKLPEKTKVIFEVTD